MCPKPQGKANGRDGKGGKSFGERGPIQLSWQSLSGVWIDIHTLPRGSICGWAYLRGFTFLLRVSSGLMYHPICFSLRE